MGEVFDKGPWTARRSDGNGVFVESDDFTHDVRLYVNGDFRDEEQCLAYAESLAEALTTAQAEIEALRARVAELEPEAETARYMREIAQSLGYPSTLEALEALSGSKP